MAERSQDSFPEAVRQILDERAMSLRGLAREADVNVSHLSRVLSGSYPREPSRDLVVRIAEALDLPEDYIPEARAALVVERVKADPVLRDRLYRQLVAKRKGQRSR